MGIAGYRDRIAGGRTLDGKGVSAAGAAQLRRKGGKRCGMGTKIERPEVNTTLRGRSVYQAAVCQRQRRPDGAAAGNGQCLMNYGRSQ